MKFLYSFFLYFCFLYIKREYYYLNLELLSITSLLSHFYRFNQVFIIQTISVVFFFFFFVIFVMEYGSKSWV